MAEFTFCISGADPNEWLELRVSYGFLLGSSWRRTNNPMSRSGHFLKEYLLLDGEVVDVLTDLDTRLGATLEDICEVLEDFVEKEDGSGYVPEEHIQEIREDGTFFLIF